MGFIKPKLKLIIASILIITILVVLFRYFDMHNISLESFVKEVWANNIEQWGYLILFCWSILEGEWGLLLAGIASHQGYLNVYLCVFIAGLGGFVGDQIYFYIGRFNKGFVQSKFKNQKRKFALASLLMQKYGWPIIFIQRYMYGLRTIIPISIGLTRYSALKFAIINLISAWIWAGITIIPAWFFGEEIILFLANIVTKFKENPLLFVAVLLAVVAIIIGYFKYSNHKSKKRKK